ncbi:hypothetical protein [Glycomyces tenuis]|uniref:hypothetical protein n=1 Tax=Glycomyces tenuis TaxID=58116 RepID=UPI000426CE62|nr:hypothetical protein [Glycomyces tenuis]
MRDEDGASAARRAGLGRKLRTYRQRRKSPWPGYGAVIGSLIALVSYYGENDLELSYRLWAVLAPLGLVLGLAYNHFAAMPVMPDVRGRLRLDLHEHGVLIRPRNGGPSAVEPVVLTAGRDVEIRWDTPNLRLVWNDEAHGGAKVHTRLDEFGGSGSLRRALVDGLMPKSPLSGGALALGAVALVLVPLYVWMFVPLPVSIPENAEHLERFCSDEDMTFEDSPRFDGTGDHAIVDWVDRDGDMYEATDEETQEPEVASPEDERDAALIACGEARLGDRVDVCEYSEFSADGDVEGSTVDAYAVTFDFVVYEAATHERVGEVSVKPQPDDSHCPTLLEGAVARILVEPSPEDVYAAIVPFTEEGADG